LLKLSNVSFKLQAIDDNVSSFERQRLKGTSETQSSAQAERLRAKHCCSFDIFKGETSPGSTLMKKINGSGVGGQLFNFMLWRTACVKLLKKLRYYGHHSWYKNKDVKKNVEHARLLDSISCKISTRLIFK